MQRDNNFNSPIVDAILTIGFADYNPFTQQLMSERYQYALDFHEEIPVDSMTLGDYIELKNSQKDSLYAKFFSDDTYKEQFCFEMYVGDSFYELRLVVMSDVLDDALEEIAVELYDDEEEEDEDEDY